MGTLLRSAERLAVPVTMLLVLGAVGFITAATGGITDTLLAFYSMSWFGSLLFVAYWSRARTTDPTDQTDPLLVLQQRYACGEIDESTFERRLDRLVADEHLERARRGVGRRLGRTDTARSR